MTESFRESESESLALPESMAVVRPAGVGLFLSGKEETHLPKEIANHPELLGQAAQRRELYSKMGRIFEQVSDVNMDLSEAADRSLVSAEDMTEIYERLTNFIETDENNARIILYLPFEMLPQLTDSKREPVQEKFRNAYKKAWLRLLHESDVRASFVNGDVLEPGMGEPPRVRKAAHLIPEILQRRLIQTSDIIEQFEINSEEELLQSLTEGILVAADRKLIDENDWRKIKAIAKEKPIIDLTLKASQKMAKPENDLIINKEDLTNKQLLELIAERLAVELANIEAHYQAVSGISPERVKWERQVKYDEVVDQLAQELAEEFQHGRLSLRQVESFCERQRTNEAYAITGIRSMVMAGEALAKSDFQKAQKFVSDCLPLIQKLWEKDSLEIKDAVNSGLAHWTRLGLINEEALNKFGVKLPDLSSPFPVDLEDLDLKYLAEATKKIEEHPVLAKHVYPLFILFGSQLKGYAGLEADCDLALFIRPGTDWEKREEIRGLLGQVIPKLETDKIIEFWVEKKEGKYGLRTITDGPRAVAGAPQIHFLFGGVWLGRGEEFKKIYEDLVEKYLDLNRFGDQKDRVRIHMLRQIELDVLQYRLMHKGYRRLYPNKRGKGSEHADLIDWESDFWDLGYRRIASLLFVSRVFLPDLQINR
jgi:hypothetical protein